MSVASRRAGVAASMDRTDTVFLMDFMILSIPGKSPNSRAWSWIRRIMSSIEWQLLSFSAIGCVANVILVIFSYSCRAASKSVRKRDGRDSRLMLAWNKGLRYCEGMIYSMIRAWMWARGMIQNGSRRKITTWLSRWTITPAYNTFPRTKPGVDRQLTRRGYHDPNRVQHLNFVLPTTRPFDFQLIPYTSSKRPNKTGETQQ